MFRSRLLLPASIPCHASSICRSPFASTRDARNEEEFAAARQWLTRLDPNTIPRETCEISFSRSSGPGGQNVNKVSSKATIRVPISALLQRVPKILHPTILNSRYRATKSNDLVIQADNSRKQGDNVDLCFRKLHELLVQAGRENVPGETNAEQAKRVEQFQRAEAAGRRKLKEYQSNKKSARSSSRRDD